MVALNTDLNQDVRAAAIATLGTLNPDTFSHLAAHSETHADVLGFLCLWPRAPRELVEAIIFNPSTPDGALAQLAARSPDSKIIEAISLKQQSLIRSPEIIDAILTNSARTHEAERRAREVREEFFEKHFGVRMIAAEQRVQADAAREAGLADPLLRLNLSVRFGVALFEFFHHPPAFQTLVRPFSRRGPSPPQQ